MNAKIAVLSPNERRRSGIAACIAVCLFVGSALATRAAPLQQPVLSPLTVLAREIDASATSGDWVTAQRRHVELVKKWSTQRPAVVRGIKGTAHAQSIDASLKWMQIALERRVKVEVHRAAYNIQKSIHEISEIPPPHA